MSTYEKDIIEKFAKYLAENAGYDDMRFNLSICGFPKEEIDRIIDKRRNVDLFFDPKTYIEKIIDRELGGFLQIEITVPPSYRDKLSEEIKDKLPSLRKSDIIKVSFYESEKEQVEEILNKLIEIKVK